MVHGNADETQRRHWADADLRHLEWQTTGWFGETERALLEQADVSRDGRILEIGCGEGANLIHLGSPPRSVGVDFSRPKLSVARDRLRGVSVAQADARALPFADASFDTVLIRDVLHHVRDCTSVIAEAARVLRRGGRLAVIEPNRNSPLILGQALLVRAERGVLRSRARWLRAQLERAELTSVRISRAQPLPLARVLLHPKHGGPFARSRATERLLRLLDSITPRLVPRWAWMYLIANAVRSEA
jgi:SAM-dependent methyltransferase